MSDIVMSLMSVMFSTMAKRIYLMSSGHQYLLTGSTPHSSSLLPRWFYLSNLLRSDQFFLIHYDGALYSW